MLLGVEVVVDPDAGPHAIGGLGAQCRLGAIGPNGASQAQLAGQGAAGGVRPICGVVAAWRDRRVSTVVGAPLGGMGPGAGARRAGRAGEPCWLSGGGLRGAVVTIHARRWYRMRVCGTVKSVRQDKSPFGGCAQALGSSANSTRTVRPSALPGAELFLGAWVLRGAWLMCARC